MEQENELVYLGRRASEERRAARATGNRLVREVHLEFASAYEFRIHLLREQARFQAERPRTIDDPPAIDLAEHSQGVILQEVPLLIGEEGVNDIYRLYSVDQSGKIISAKALDAESDEEAVRLACALNRAGGCELWRRDTFLAAIPLTPASDAAADLSMSLAGTPA